MSIRTPSPSRQNPAWRGPADRPDCARRHGARRGDAGAIGGHRHLVAGNLTFKQRAIHASDEGVRQGFLWLRNTIIGNPASLNNSIVGNGYFSTQHADDPNWNPAANWPVGSVVSLPEDAGGNTVSYVIHRLCTLPGLAYNAPNQQCATYTGTSSASSGGSQSVDAPEFTGVVYVYFRVTARVNGPRNTVSYIQSLMLAPAS